MLCGVILPTSRQKSQPSVGAGQGGGRGGRAGIGRDGSLTAFSPKDAALGGRVMCLWIELVFGRVLPEISRVTTPDSREWLGVR
jgi:hypothetical protein